MKLDTTSLGNAVRRLREGLARCEREPADEQVRDGLIQRFEFTYELCHKMLRRYLKQAAASPDEIEQMPFADLIRAGNAQGVLWADWSAWRRFREVRAETLRDVRRHRGAIEHQAVGEPAHLGSQQPGGHQQQVHRGELLRHVVGEVEHERVAQHRDGDQRAQRRRAPEEQQQAAQRLRDAEERGTSVEDAIMAAARG